MPKPCVLCKCPTWWNVETRDGWVMFSSEHKMVARFYQRLANNKNFQNHTNGQMNQLLRVYGRWLAQNNIEVT